MHEHLAKIIKVHEELHDKPVHCHCSKCGTYMFSMETGFESIDKTTPCDICRLQKQIDNLRADIEGLDDDTKILKQRSNEIMDNIDPYKPALARIPT